MSELSHKLHAALTGETPRPADPVITLPRHLVETALAELEQTNPLRSLVIELRAALAAPEEPLWCLFSPGPNDLYPAPDYDQALEHATDFNAHMVEMAARQGWEHTPHMDVIPSPYTPVEHFEIMAEQALDEVAELRQALHDAQSHAHEATPC